MVMTGIWVLCIFGFIVYLNKEVALSLGSGQVCFLFVAVGILRTIDCVMQLLIYSLRE